jgi:type I restriction enzyme S subunit
VSKWEKVKLGDVCDVERGGSPRPIDKFITEDGNGINWIKIGDTTDNSMYITKTKQKINPEGMKKSRYVQPGDFLLSNSMSFGRPYILKIDGCIHDGWLVLRDKNNYFYKEYLYYALSSKATYQKFKMLAVGGVVNNLNSTLVKQVEFPLPPIETQKQIAKTLDTAAELLAMRKQQLVELDNLIKSVFYDMFGDPVVNEKGWEIKKMGEVCSKITDGKHGDCKDEIASGYYFISAKDIDNGAIQYDKARQIIEADFEDTNKRTKLSPGDIVVVNTGATIGKTAIVTDDDRTYRTTFQKSVGVIQVLPDELSNLFLQYHIIMDRENIYNSASGSAQKNWLLSQMRNYSILLPPINLHIR